MVPAIYDFQDLSVTTLFDSFDRLGEVINEGDRPALLWNPVIQTTGPGIGVVGGKSVFTVNSDNDLTLLVEATDDTRRGSWEEMGQLVTDGGMAEFADPEWARSALNVVDVSTSTPTSTGSVFRSVYAIESSYRPSPRDPALGVAFRAGHP